MKTSAFVTRSLLTALHTARHRPRLAWVIAFAFFLGTPFAPAPWAVNLAAQTYTLNSTTTSAAVAATDTTVSLTATTAATGSTFGAVSVGQGMFIDQEYMLITGLAGSVATVQRRNNRSSAAGGITTHISGASVQIGAPFAFQHVDPAVGVCAVGSQGDPWVNVENGRVWRCLASQWLNVVDAYVFVGPGSCFGTTTTGTLTTPAAVANVNLYATTWTGLINSSATAPGTPVIQVSTTNAAGAAINTVSCQVPLPTRANLSRGVYLADVVWAYGLQQNAANATQVATEASGLLNGVVAFGKIVLPAPAASETPSTVAQARWDAGTMVLLPAKAAFNSAVTTTGGFATQKITPATPIAMTTDLTLYYVNFTVLHTTTVASTLQVAGAFIHYYTVAGL